MKKLISTQNPLVKHLVKLNKNRDYRHSHGSLMIEGKKLVQEVCRDRVAKNLLVTDPKFISEEIQAEETFLVSHEVMKKICETQTPEGIIAEISFPFEQTLTRGSHILALDGISDPGNMGTLIRTTLAFGWDGVFILENCCDPYNGKAIRSAKGATFRIPIELGSWEQLEKIVKDNHLNPIAADTEGKELAEFDTNKPYLLVLGNESRGLSDETMKNCEKITIPMSGKMESLNVAVAGGILMYFLS